MSALWLLFSTLQRQPPPLDHVDHVDQTCSVSLHHFMRPRWFHSALVSTWTLKASVMGRRPLDSPLSNYWRPGGKIRRCSPGLKTSVSLWCELIQPPNSWDRGLDSLGMRNDSWEKLGEGLQGLSCGFSEHHRQEVIQLLFTTLLSCTVKGD